MEQTIRIDNLSKTYSLGKDRTVTALQPLTMSIGSGEVFGLLGPNGAGKTTLVKLLLGITSPSSGTAYVLGDAIPSVRARRFVGFLPENHRYPPHLSGEQTLLFYGNLSGMSGKSLRTRIDELLKRVSLYDRRKQRVREYSKGMLQRLGLAQALLNSPRVLFLDEPTDGIDPLGRNEIRDLLLEEKSAGTTIFLNSHLLSEVELITDRVMIMNKGTVLRAGTTRELTESHGVYTIAYAEESPVPEQVPGLIATDPVRRTLDISVATAADLNTLIDFLRSRSVLITSIVPKRSSLEDLFLSLLNQQ